jgi:hypothetical protein
VGWLCEHYDRPEAIICLRECEYGGTRRTHTNAGSTHPLPISRLAYAVGRIGGGRVRSRPQIDLVFENEGILARLVCLNVILYQIQPGLSLMVSKKRSDRGERGQTCVIEPVRPRL